MSAPCTIAPSPTPVPSCVKMPGEVFATGTVTWVVVPLLFVTVTVAVVPPVKP